MAAEPDAPSMLSKGGSQAQPAWRAPAVGHGHAPLWAIQHTPHGIYSNPSQSRMGHAVAVAEHAVDGERHDERA
jgi:hypothetical protein